MSWLNNLKVRSKALLLVGMALLTAATMAAVTALGLSSLKTSLDQATLSTNVERYAFRTILQEKAYLLNANAATRNAELAAQAFQQASEDVSVINETLDKIERFDDPALKKHAEAARKGTAEYAALYRQGVDALQTQGRETEALENEGETATQQAKDYIKSIGDPQKKIIAQSILEYTYLIRANEKRYMLYQKPEMFEAMKSEFDQMMKQFDTLARGASSDAERQLVATFERAAENYEKAALSWVEHNSALYGTILPKMQTLGNQVIQLAFDAATEQQQRMDGTRQNTIITLLAVAFAIAMIGIGLGLLVSGALSRPMVALASCIERLAAGELTVEVPNAEQRDEIGAMARSLTVLRGELQRADQLRRDTASKDASEREALVHRENLAEGFVAQMQSLAKGFASSSDEVADAARNLSATAEETARQAQSVAAAAEEASANVETVASSSEEMAASVREINGQVVRASKATETAYTEADAANRRIGGLATAAAAIGDVVGLINGIAAQTNLLALNATIEAARAGEAGKGFAVVAAEVKLLADQTAKATDEIAHKVGEIQEATSDSVKSMEQIVRSIDAVKELTTAITTAVEQQGSATVEIARNTQQAATGTMQVTQNISGVGQAAEMTGTASTHLMTLSSDLSERATSLGQTVDSFVRDFTSA